MAAGAEEDRTADGFGEDQDGVAIVSFAALLLEARECVCRWRSEMSGNRYDNDLAGFGRDPAARERRSFAESIKADKVASLASRPLLGAAR